MDRQFFEKIKYIKFDEFLNSAPIYFRASIFDHILSETEAQELLGKVSKEDQEARNFKTDYFILRLSQKFSTYNIRRVKNKKSFYFKFNHLTPMFRYRFGVYSASGESVQGGFILAIPDIQTIVYQGFDDTHHIYQLKQRSLEFESVIRECGLFILN